MNEIVAIVPWHDKFFIFYRTGRIVQAEIAETYGEPEFRFTVLNTEVPRDIR